ncbi:PD-(D/E)XK nuclease family protein [bacterium]|nr:PD-(D/E)XK nuclease family protein [bacterium]
MFFPNHRNIFIPNSKEPFSLSRSKIDLFLQCKKCFYLDIKKGIKRPPSFPFTLNSAVDALLKKEFDIHRAQGEAHPLMKKYGIDAVPLNDFHIAEWRNNFKGIRFYHKPTNFIVFGALDDVWQNPQGELIVVDYKATSTTGNINLNDGREYHEAYKRQVEVYQWLLRQNGYKVSDSAYFVYCNGKRDKKAFDGKLEFDIEVIEHKGDDSWVEKTLFDIKQCLESDKIPEASPDCEYCRYREKVQEAEKGLSF